MTGPRPRARAGVGELLANARLEVIPMRGIEEQVLAHLPRGAAVTITCSPRTGPDPTIALAERLAGHGYAVLPHLSARTVRSAGHLQEILARLREARVRGVFAIGGDGHDPVGPYASAGELLEAIHSAGDADLSEIGVAGYPEGHPLIEDERLMEALAWKAPLASHVATQICFDAKAIARWIARIRERGIELPVFIGMPGAVKRRKLLEVALRVGVGPSVRFVSSQGSLVARLMRRGGYRPDAFLAGATSLLTDPRLGVRGLHMYSFNQVETVERWRREIVDMYDVDEANGEADAAS